MYLLHHAGLLKHSLGSNCNPAQHLMWHQKIYFYILIVLFTPNWMLQSSEKLSLSLRQSFIDQHWMKEEGNCRSIIFVLATIVSSKNKNIYLRDSRMWILILLILLIAYFEIEESFGLIWVKLQKSRFHLQISILDA